jgi:hypothetical protein
LVVFYNNQRSMEDSRLGRLEQQISSLMTMIEGFIKKKEEHIEMMEKNMEIIEKNIDNLLSKKGFDVQKNEVIVQPFRHVEAPIPQLNLTTTQFCHHPIAPTVVILSSTVLPPLAFVYKRCHHFNRETTTVAIHQPPRLTPTSHLSYKMKKNIGDLKFLPKIGDVMRVDVEKKLALLWLTIRPFI